MLTMSQFLTVKDLEKMRALYNGIDGTTSVDGVEGQGGAVSAPRRPKVPRANTRAQKQAEAIREAKARRDAKPSKAERLQAKNAALLQGERFEVRRGAEVQSPCPADKRRTYTVAQIRGTYTQADVRVYYGHKDTCGLTGNQYGELHLLDVLDREGRKIFQVQVGPQFRRELMIDHFRHTLLQLRSQK